LHKWEKHLGLILPPFLLPAHSHGQSSSLPFPHWADASPIPRARSRLFPLCFQRWASPLTWCSPAGCSPPPFPLLHANDPVAPLVSIVVYLRVNDENTASILTQTLQVGQSCITELILIVSIKDPTLIILSVYLLNCDVNVLFSGLFGQGNVAFLLLL
jgi:hypothetical protein